MTTESSNGKYTLMATSNSWCIVNGQPSTVPWTKIEKRKRRREKEH